jgi:hypothetical protein
MQEAGPVGVLDEALQVRGGAGLLAEEGGQVAGHGRVLRERQPDLGQGAAGALRRAVGDRTSGKKPSISVAVDLGAGQLGADAAADELGAAARHHQRHRLQRLVGQQRLLGCRQPWVRAWSCQRSSSTPPALSFCLTRCARVRSMLSPPSRMCSPTATRVSSSAPSCSVTAISDRSVVPPPTSTTRMMSPTLTSWRQRPLLSLTQL